MFLGLLFAAVLAPSCLGHPASLPSKAVPVSETGPEAAPVWMGCYRDELGEAGCFCCEQSSQTWYALCSIEPYVGMSPWYEFTELRNEGTCMNYCRTVVQPNGYDTCRGSSSPNCLGHIGNGSSPLKCGFDVKSKVAVGGANSSDGTGKVTAASIGLDPIESTAVHTLPTEGTPSPQYDDDANGPKVSEESRKWMWTCLSAPSTDPFSDCWNAGVPSDVDAGILQVTLDTLNDQYSEVCQQGSLCKGYNGVCCATFVGTARYNDALALAAEDCGGQSSPCTGAVSNVLQCLQGETNNC